MIATSHTLPAEVRPMALQSAWSAEAHALPDSDYRGILRAGLALVLFGFGGALAWAFWAPLDEAIPAPGVVAVESSRKRIDHVTGGTLEQILVKEGQRVNAGDELLVLNKAQSQSQVNTTQGQRWTAMANFARLAAERDAAARIRFPEQLLAAGSDPEVAALLRAQEDLFRSRRGALEGELGIIRESVRGLEAQLASLAQLKVGREKQIALFTEQLQSYTRLRSEGFVSRNSLLELERQLAEVQSKQSEDLSNIASINARLAEFRMRGAQREVEYRREVEAQLLEFQRELATLNEKLTGQQDTLDRHVLRAPASGRVVDLSVHTVGGVVKAGERLMDIVPESDGLIVEARMPPQYIDRVHAGLAADVRFDAYASRAERPLVEGKVLVVSADALVDERSGSGYYTLRIGLSPESLRALGKVQLQPGMPATVMVKTGERTLANYLARPLLRRLDGALGEP